METTLFASDCYVDDDVMRYQVEYMAKAEIVNYSCSQKPWR